MNDELTRNDWDLLPLQQKMNMVISFLSNADNFGTRFFNQNRPGFMPTATGIKYEFTLDWQEIQAIANVPTFGKQHHPLCDCGQRIDDSRVVTYGGIDEDIPTYTAIMPLCRQCAEFFDNEDAK